MNVAFDISIDECSRDSSVTSVNRIPIGVISNFDSVGLVLQAYDDDLLYWAMYLDSPVECLTHSLKS
ncbi:hypothetical protein EL22_28425 [Halostagnicola sp. A56]|nr:hypothetical protein EL22_28425 [Halostagnicola sp. A56]